MGWFGPLAVKVKVAQSCLTLFDPMNCSPWDSLSQDTGMGSLSLLHGIFPSQGSKPGLQLSHKGSPGTLEWKAYPFSRGSSRPRNRTGVSCIAGGFFTNWATREAEQELREQAGASAVVPTSAPSTVSRPVQPCLLTCSFPGPWLQRAPGLRVCSVVHLSFLILSLTKGSPMLRCSGYGDNCSAQTEGSPPTKRRWSSCIFQRWHPWWIWECTGLGGWHIVVMWADFSWRVFKKHTDH